MADQHSSHYEAKGFEVLAVFFLCYSLMTLLGLTVERIPVFAESSESALWTTTIRTIAFQMVFLVSPLVCYFFLKFPAPENLGLTRGPALKILSWTLITTLVAILVCYVINKALHVLLELNHLPVAEQVVVSNLRDSTNTSIVYTMIATITVLAPLAEELFFRGLLYHLLQKRGRIMACVVISVLFGLIHYSSNDSSVAGILSGLIRTVPMMVLSGFLFAAYIVTGNILAPVGCHFLFNLFGVIGIKGLQFL